MLRLESTFVRFRCHFRRAPFDISRAFDPGRTLESNGRVSIRASKEILTLSRAEKTAGRASVAHSHFECTGLSFCAILGHSAQTCRAEQA